MGERARKKAKRNVVRFAEEADVHVYDTEDAPGANVYDVVASPKKRGGRRGSKERDENKENEDNGDPALSLDSCGPPTPQKFGLSLFKGEVKEEFDTETMTAAELRDALSLMGLSTRGKKTELKDRLEGALSAPTTPSSAPTKKRPAVQRQKTPDWLAW